MYCPQCATQHIDGAKFCRSCGTEIETVSLVLSGKPVEFTKGNADKNARQSETESTPKTAQHWIEKYSESVGGVTTGAILMVVSFLLGVALAYFVPHSFDVPWILVWSALFGWMAIWGGIEMAYGIAGMLESKSGLRLMNSLGKESTTDATTPRLLSVGEPPIKTNLSDVFNSHASPSSVTEGTTRQLDDMVGR